MRPVLRLNVYDYTRTRLLDMSVKDNTCHLIHVFDTSVDDMANHVSLKAFEMVDTC